MGNSLNCGFKKCCLNSDDKNQVKFEDENGVSYMDTNNIETNMISERDLQGSGTKLKSDRSDNNYNQLDREDSCEDGDNEILQNGTAIDKIILKRFNEKLKLLGEFVDESLLDETIKSCVYDSDQILKRFKTNSKFNKKVFGFTIDKPLIRLNYDGSFYKGQWSIDLKRNGFGILIKSDGSRYQGTWINDIISGIGRFSNINGNYYEGNHLYINLLL